MCDNCEEREQTLDNSSELQEMEGLSYLLMNVDNLDDVEFDDKSFKKGVKDASYKCGYLTALINAGLSPEQAFQIIINDDTIAYNIENQKMICENNIDVAKIQESILLNKGQL